MSTVTITWYDDIEPSKDMTSKAYERAAKMIAEGWVKGDILEFITNDDGEKVLDDEGNESEACGWWSLEK